MAKILSLIEVGAEGNEMSEIGPLFIQGVSHNA